MKNSKRGYKKSRKFDSTCNELDMFDYEDDYTSRNEHSSSDKKAAIRKARRSAAAEKAGIEPKF